MVAKIKGFKHTILWQRLNFFYTVLYQFLETETPDRTFISLDQLLKCYISFHFSFTVPLIIKIPLDIWSGTTQRYSDRRGISKLFNYSIIELAN